MSPGAHGATNPTRCFQEPRSGGARPRLGPRLGNMDGKRTHCPAERQTGCQTPELFAQQGCYAGEYLPPMELLPQTPMQFQAPPAILSTAPTVSAGPTPPRGDMPRHILSWEETGRHPLPPGFVMPVPPTAGHGYMPLTPFARGSMQDCRAPSAALGLLEAAPHFDMSGGTEALAGAVGGQPGHEACGPYGLPAPLLIRNTFLDAKPVRSPSLDPFFEERKVKSSPPSRPHSGKLELATPRAMPDRFGSPLCSLYNVPTADDCGEGGLLHHQPGQVTPFSSDGLPLLNLSQELLQGSSMATPEPSYRDAWPPAPLVVPPPVAGTASSSSGGSAELVGSAASIGASTATPGGGDRRPKPRKPRAPRPPPALGAKAAERLDSEPPVLGSPELPSRGSALHAWGACKPCAFVFSEGCQNDLDCQFCHLCEPGERKRRKKERLANKREAREDARRRRQEAGLPCGRRPRASAAEHLLDSGSAGAALQA
mmetsp:Transcript_74623/g.230643  ORF Transcript_74623/g.230643 Transcript_74623/m.230643 type:complete len:484 (+) Transcript_74623:66-1517(+)